MNEKIWAPLSTGFFMIMLIPRFKNGLVKSTTFSLSDVIVIGATAICTFYNKVKCCVMTITIPFFPFPFFYCFLLKIAVNLNKFNVCGIKSLFIN